MAVISNLAPISLRTLPSEPLVSVLVANYNYAHFLPVALDSLLAQTYSGFEVIICDDGSIDTSCEVAASYSEKDTRIRLIRQPNGGVGKALNTAYAASKGDVICLLDADDYFMPQKLELVIERMRTPGVGFVLHAMQVVDGEGRTIRQLPTRRQHEKGWIADRVVQRGGRWRSMPASALAFHRDIADLLFPMPADSLLSLADAYLYMLAPLFTEVDFIAEPLSAYRLHGANLTGTTAFSLENSKKFVSGMQRVHRSINEKRQAEGYEIPPLELDDHLTCQEQQYLIHLFEGLPIRNIWPQYKALSRLIWHDDVYQIQRKLLGLAVMGSAMMLPKEKRPGWITRFLG